MSSSLNEPQRDEPRTAYLRIGSDKAGTTSVASFAQQNRLALKEKGIETPVRNCARLIARLVAQHGIEHVGSFESKNANASEEEAAQTFLQNYEIIEDNDIFLTTETLWGRLTKTNIRNGKRLDETKRLLEAIGTFLHRHKVKIILHLRRADTYVESLYNQAVKAGDGNSFDNFRERFTLKNIPANSLCLLSALEDRFGRENILIRPLERSQLTEGDLLTDLLRIMGLESWDGLTRPPMQNESLHRALLEVLSEINQLHGKILSNRQLQELSRALREEHGIPDQKLILPLEERVKIMEDFEPFYSAVREGYRGGEPLFLDPLPNDDHLTYTVEEDVKEFVRSLLLRTSKEPQAGAACAG